MGPRKGTLKRECSHLTDNCEIPQYDIRLMRRLKRRSVVSEMMEQNYSANAKRKNVGSCGHEVVKNAENSGHILEEEVDEDYGFLLDEVFFHVDAVSDDNIIASDIDVNTSHDSDNDGFTDAQYKMFLENLREDEKSYILKAFVDNKFFCVKYEGKQERLHDFVNSEIQCECDEDYQLFLNSSRLDGDHLICMPERAAIAIKFGGSESEGTISKIKQNLQFPFEVTELAISGQASDDHLVAKNKLPSEVLSDVVDEDWQIYLNYGVRNDSEEKPSAIRQSLQVSNEATEPSNAGLASCDYHVVKNKCHNEVLSDVVDEYWEIYLNSEIRKNSEEKPSAVRQSLQVSNEATELSNAGQASDDYCVAKNKFPSDVVDEDWLIYLNSEVRKGSEEKPSAVRHRLQVSNEANEPSNAGQASDDYCVAKNKFSSDVVDEDWLIYLNSEVRKNSEEKPSAVRHRLQVSNEATEPSNAGHASDDYCVAKNKFPSDVVDEDWLIYLNSEVRKNSEEKLSSVEMNLQVYNEATELPNARHDSAASHVAKHKCNNKELCNIMDENYQLFLRSVFTNGDDLIYMPENGVTVVFGEECEQSSADSEPIILDPSKHYESSPPISSKSYYSAYLGDERNNEDTLYRKGLMEELERPYIQKELEELLQLALHERPKEQHREMRHGVTKDRPKGGDDNKTSYLKMHSGLKTAIDQVKEPHKVLFLLRGFFYWLKHVPQGGAFRPWLDTSCLKMLQKL